MGVINKRFQGMDTHLWLLILENSWWLLQHTAGLIAIEANETESQKGPQTWPRVKPPGWRGGHGDVQRAWSLGHPSGGYQRWLFSVRLRSTRRWVYPWGDVRRSNKGYRIYSWNCHYFIYVTIVCYCGEPPYDYHSSWWFIKSCVDTCGSYDAIMRQCEGSVLLCFTASNMVHRFEKLLWEEGPRPIVQCLWSRLR